MTKILLITEGKYILLYTGYGAGPAYTEQFEVAYPDQSSAKEFIKNTLIPYLNDKENYFSGSLADKNKITYTGRLTKSDFEIIED